MDTDERVVKTCREGALRKVPQAALVARTQSGPPQLGDDLNPYATNTRTSATSTVGDHLWRLIHLLTIRECRTEGLRGHSDSINQQERGYVFSLR